MVKSLIGLVTPFESLLAVAAGVLMPADEDEEGEDDNDWTWPVLLLLLCVAPEYNSNPDECSMDCAAVLLEQLVVAVVGVVVVGCLSFAVFELLAAIGVVVAVLFRVSLSAKYMRREGTEVERCVADCCLGALVEAVALMRDEDEDGEEVIIIVCREAVEGENPIAW